LETSKSKFFIVAYLKREGDGRERERICDGEMGEERREKRKKREQRKEEKDKTDGERQIK